MYISPLICLIGATLVIFIHQRQTTLIVVYMTCNSTSPSHYTNFPLIKSNIWFIGPHFVSNSSPQINDCNQSISTSELTCQIHEVAHQLPL
jgi:hypothetical protein